MIRMKIIDRKYQNMTYVLKKKTVTVEEKYVCFQRENRGKDSYQKR